MSDEPDILFRRMATDVTIRQREVDVRAVPYGSKAEVYDQLEQRHYVESIAADAFAWEPIRPNRIKVLRDHETTRLVGHCRAVKPNLPDGLHATFNISRTALGDESLELARDGSLHVSIGFSRDPTGDHWTDDRAEVVRHRCTLWEVSLVPFPAYDGADVLAVRRAPQTPAERPVTPYLDRIRLQRLRDAYDQIASA
jgi:hypothetical protein